uniref:putative glutamine amidotransferase-like class 1 domain-containing protein 3B, mitochondrial isoform X3 n=1 Tax=Myxine glutinosa TaxID=7769 RepID=UPI00358E0388
MLSSRIAFRGVLRALHSGRPLGAPRVAVVLSGAGVYDGSELHEASAVLVHLSRGGAKVKIFAPNIPQMHVVDHTKGQPVEGETRNVLVESARIARGNIDELKQLSVSEHDAVIFPGGFGAAKNLSSFAVDGPACKVEPEVERILKEFHKAQKPIGQVNATQVPMQCPLLPVLHRSRACRKAAAVGGAHSRPRVRGRWSVATCRCCRCCQDHGSHARTQGGYGIPRGLA